MSPGSGQEASGRKAPAHGSDALPSIRTMILALLLLGCAATGIELILLDHYEDAAQSVPLALVGLGLAALGWVRLRGSRASILALRFVMGLFVLGGLIGLVLHYQGNREFQLEVNPSLSGMALFMKVMRAKAPPALAPAVLSQLGLLGLACTYRHPSLEQRPSPTDTSKGAHNDRN